MASQLRWLSLAFSFASVASYMPSSLAAQQLAPTQASAQLRAQANSQPSGADQLFEQGKQHYWRSDYPAAQASWEQALASYRQANNPSGEAATLSQLGTAFEATGDYDEADRYYRESLEIAREIGDRRAEAASLNGVATVIYYQDRDWLTALDYGEQSLAIYREIRDLSGEAEVLNHLASPLYQLNRSTEALEYYNQSRAIYQTIDQQPGTVDNLIDLGSYHLLTGEISQGLELAEKALAISKEIGYRAGTARALAWIGYRYEAEEDYEQALEFYSQGLPIANDVGTRHNAADIYAAKARVHSLLKNYEQAIDDYQQALLLHRELDDGDREINTLIKIGITYEWLEQFETAENYHQQALSKAQAVNDRAREVEAQHRLAVTDAFSDRYEEAIEIYQESLTVSRQRKNAEEESTTLSRIGSIYRQREDYDEAIDYYTQSLAITQALNDTDKEITTLKNIGHTFYQSRRYIRAVGYYQDSYWLASEINDLSSAADSLNRIGLAYRALDADETAVEYYFQSLEIIQSLEDKVFEGALLSNIGISYESLGDVENALSYYQQSLSIKKEIGDIEATTSTLNRIADFHRRRENYEEAISHYQQILSFNQTTDDPKIKIGALGNIGVAYEAQENYTAAKQAYEAAFALLKQEDVEIMESIYRSRTRFEGSSVSSFLGNLAKIYWNEQEFEKAAVVLATISELEEKGLVASFSNFGNIEPLARLAAVVNLVNTDGLIAVHAGEIPDNETIAKTVLLNILRRKGRTMEALATTSRRLWQGDSELDQTTRQQLSAAYTRLADVSLSRTEGRSAAEYEAEAEEIKASITDINNAWIKERQASVTESPLITSDAVSVEGVQAQIPADAALVEIVRHSTYGQAQNTSRYAAYVLTQQGDIKAVDLGDAEAIDRQADAFGQALQTRSANFKAVSRQLDQQLMQPIRALVGDKTHLLISPDGQLNAIPFDALIDEQNQYLIESYHTSYLNSGRDLLTLNSDRLSQQPPVIIADPNYNNLETQIAINPTAIRSLDLSTLQVGPLPGTRAEAEAIAALLPNANIYMQQAATEETLKQVEAPSILHIATHGFFLPDITFTPAANTNTPDRGLDGSPYNPPAQPTTNRAADSSENPLLRSGLALAGFNARRSGSEDGVFTALEASGLNLHGTQLVVLSACETGIGDATTGEGVYGLRRAFTIAGAESQLMSLWKVSDTGTARLMTLYYQNLMEKEQGRSEALRNAQLQMLEDEQYNDPFYWSAFIFSGDWRPLD